MDSWRQACFVVSYMVASQGGMKLNHMKSPTPYALLLTVFTLIHLTTQPPGYGSPATPADSTQWKLRDSQGKDDFSWLLFRSGNMLGTFYTKHPTPTHNPLTQSLSLVKALSSLLYKLTFKWFASSHTQSPKDVWVDFWPSSSRKEARAQSLCEHFAEE